MTLELSQAAITNINSLLRLGELLNEYNVNLRQLVALNQEISILLSREIAPSVREVESAFVTEREAPAVEVLPTKVHVVLSSPITEQAPKVMKHYNLATSPTISTDTLFTFEGIPVWLIIDNIDATNDIQVSFDNKKTWKQLSQDSALNLPLWFLPPGIKSFYYRSTQAASVSFELLSGEN